MLAFCTSNRGSRAESQDPSRHRVEPRRRRERSGGREGRPEVPGGRGDVPLRRPHPAPQPPPLPAPACLACRSCPEAAAVTRPDLPHSGEGGDSFELFGVTLGLSEALERVAGGVPGSRLVRRCAREGVGPLSFGPDGRRSVSRQPTTSSPPSSTSPRPP